MLLLLLLLLLFVVNSSDGVALFSNGQSAIGEFDTAESWVGPFNFVLSANEKMFITDVDNNVVHPSNLVS